MPYDSCVDVVGGAPGRVAGSASVAVGGAPGAHALGETLRWLATAPVPAIAAAAGCSAAEALAIAEQAHRLAGALAIPRAGLL